MIETNRLILRKFTLDDVEGYFRLNSNPGVVRYTGDDPFSSLEDARQTLLKAPLRDYDIHGYGRLACVKKSSGKLIGFAGLKYLSEMDEVDLGYRFLTEYWGKGYATESSVAVMDYGRNVLGLGRIIGIVQPGNVASAKVLLKLGMLYERKVKYGSEESEHDLYATRF
ncbi:MAG: GNAT family N-acetyltransferase [Rhodanobacteraceae bacterium]